MQYDFGTRLQCDDSQQDSFVVKGFLRDAPTALQTAVTKLRSKAMVDGYEYPEIYEKMLTDKPRMKRKFQKPMADVLYNADYTHQGGDDCSACDVLYMVKRHDRDADEELVHFGLIGSGNQVIRDALFRDKLYRDEKIICFEMEAAGLTEDFECLVIRGICDYCDSHKNKIWQPYAAGIAAAYAKELLLTLPPKQVEDMPKSKILESIIGDLKEIKAQNVEVMTIHRSSALASAIEWIAARNPDIDFGKARQRKELGTGTWLTESKSYLQWKIGNVRHVWIYGKVRDTTICGNVLTSNKKAGSGKSVLTATAIPDIQSHCANIDAGFAMFYFVYSDMEKPSWKSCLKSLVNQLGDCVSSMLIQAHQSSKGPPSEELLTSILLTAIRSYKEVFIVLDALDESPETAEGDETVPKTLDETYERMLKAIDQDLEVAVVLVRWLAYAQRPLTLHELAETVTIELHPENDVVNTENCPVLEGIMELLSGLITIKVDGRDEAIDESDVSDFPEDLRTVYVGLAHFSVKEYLESDRSAMLEFHLVADHDRHFLANCCLVYIMDYAESEKRVASVEDLERFPLLKYAAKSWYGHYPSTGDANQRVVSFLQSVEFTLHFLFRRQR